jgi:hypothetical protein
VFKCLMFLIIAGVLHCSMHTDVRKLPEIVLFSIKLVIVLVVTYHSVSWYWSACQFTKKLITLLIQSGFVSTFCNAKLLCIAIGILVCYTYSVQILSIGLTMCMGSMSEASYVQSLCFMGSMLLLLVLPSSELVSLIFSSGYGPPPERDVAWLFAWFLGACVLAIGYTYLLGTLLCLRGLLALILGRSPRNSRVYDSTMSRIVSQGILYALYHSEVFVVSEWLVVFAVTLSLFGAAPVRVWAWGCPVAGLIATLASFWILIH